MHNVLWIKNNTKLIPAESLVINWAHPLAYGLTACYLPGKIFFDSLVRQGIILTANANYPSPVMTAEGPAVNQTTSGGLKGTAPPHFIKMATSTGASLYWRGYVSSNSGANSNVWGISHNSGLTTPFNYISCLAGASGTTVGTQVASNNGAGGSITKASAALTVSRINSMAAVIAMSGGTGTLSAYVNGVNAGAPTALTGVPAVGSGPLVRIGDSAATNIYALMVLYWAQRTLSNADVMALHVDPYDIFESLELPITNTTAAAGFKGYLIRSNSVLGTGTI